MKTGDLVKYKNDQLLGVVLKTETGKYAMCYVFMAETGSKQWWPVALLEVMNEDR